MSHERQTREVAFTCLLAEYAESFWKLFGHAQRSEWSERQAATGVPERMLNQLYSLGYENVDARLTALARINPKFIDALNQSLLASGAAISLLIVFADISLEDMGAALSSSGYYPEVCTRLEAFAKTSPAGAADHRYFHHVLSLERALGRLIWAFSHPGAFDSQKQVRLIEALNLWRGSLISAWGIRAPELVARCYKFEAEETFLVA